MVKHNIVDCSKGKPGEGLRVIVEVPDDRPPPPPPPTIEEKLATLGISLADLKNALK